VEKTNCNTDIEHLQHICVEAYSLNLSSDAILFHSARALTKGTFRRFFWIRKGDTYFLGFFFRCCPTCLYIIFWNWVQSCELCSCSSGDNRTEGVKQLISSIGSSGKIVWDAATLGPPSPMTVLSRIANSSWASSFCYSNHASYSACCAFCSLVKRSLVH
jgi:hypothetical protein